MSRRTDFRRLKSYSSTTALLEGQAVKLAANGHEISAVTAVSDRVFGFTYGQAFVANETAEIYREGSEAIARSGAAVTFGDRLKIDATGKVVPAAGTEPSIGWAMEAATAADQLIRIYFAREGLIATS